MIYMWKDGLPILFHSLILEEPARYMKYIQEFYTQYGLDALVSLRTKKVFMSLGGIRIPMAGGRTLLHLAVEHQKDDAVEYMLQIQFPSLEDDGKILPEDISTSDSIRAFLNSHNRNRSVDAVEKIKNSYKKLLAEKPTPDTFREPFLTCYNSPFMTLPSVEDVEVESYENGNVFVIRNFLSEVKRDTILNLYKTHLASAKQKPNTMSKKGYSLRGTELETFGYHFSKTLNRFASVLNVPESEHPEIAHAFFVSYDPQAETLDKHRDGGFWTANLCLKAENCEQLLEFETDSLKMEEGMLVLHKGSVLHAVTGSCPGERVNLVFWFY